MKRAILEFIEMAFFYFVAFCVIATTAVILYYATDHLKHLYRTRPIFERMRRSQWNWPVIIFIIVAWSFPISGAAFYYWLKH